MSTLAIALKEEIRRLARKEIKAQTGRTARAVAQYRRDIAQLKRSQRDLEKNVARRMSQAGQRQTAPATELNNNHARFSARSVIAQRRRTGLSAADYAKLVGVSPLTIYNWENKKSRPRHGQLAALVALRGVGKREAQEKLQAIAANAKKSTATRRRAVGRKKSA
jgi:DNA-binding transcriptional regulator YiaG